MEYWIFQYRCRKSASVLSQTVLSPRRRRAIPATTGVVKALRRNQPKPDEIHLEKITWSNYDRICRLRVTKEQDDFVARNERRCRPS